MNIEERVKKAYDLHHAGYNCAQAVLGAYVDLFDLDMDKAMTIAYGFGGGVGMTREICGTLTGGAMAIGLKYGKADAEQSAMGMLSGKYNSCKSDFGEKLRSRKKTE